MVGELARAVSDVVTGVYVGGSLATGDYRPGVSDIDAVAVIPTAPTSAMRAQLSRVHRRLTRDFEEGAALHCVYVGLPGVADTARQQWTWAFGELFRRPLSVVARAELLGDPIVVHGPPCSSWLPPVSEAELRDGARAELSGYWKRALRKRAIWRQDLYVDLGLTVWARAEATITEGTLISKTQAIERLAHSGLPAHVVDGVARRRTGEPVPISDQQRGERAVLVRRFLKDEVGRLLSHP